MHVSNARTGAGESSLRLNLVVEIPADALREAIRELGPELLAPDRVAAPEWLTLEEAAAYVRMKPSAFKRIAPQLDDIRERRGRYLYSRAGLDRLLAEGFFDFR